MSLTSFRHPFHRFFNCKISNMEWLVAYNFIIANRPRRVIQDRLDPLHISDQNLISHYRFPRHEIIRIIPELGPELGPSFLCKWVISECSIWYCWALGIRMPQGLASINDTIQNFATIKSFPRVVDVIDGTHIPIKAPSVNEHIYMNRKHFHSRNVQVICDSK